jgi:hypothetical protein
MACAWRGNYQWLLRVARPATRVVLTLALPSDTAVTGLHANPDPNPNPNPKP